jgi:hypothetical protein
MKSRWGSIAAGVSLVWLLGCAPVEQASTDGSVDRWMSADSEAVPDGGADAPADKPDPPFASAEIVADRLAGMIWNTKADPGVIAMLSAGVSRRSVGDAASQMLADARAREGLAAFYRWWLFFSTAKPGDDADPLTSALRSEAPSLGTYLTLDADATFSDLLTAPFTFMNEELAPRYGVTGVAGPEMRRVPYPAGEPRIGLLTGAGLLSFYSSLVNPSWPAKRGWMITDPLLCAPLIRSFLPSFEPDVTKSIRQQMIDVTAGSSCMECHKVLNSAGFAFIGFDSMGRWHPEPGAAATETEGWIPDVIMPDAPRFNGPAELARLLVAREETRRCFVRQWMQFALNRDVQITSKTGPDDLDSVEAALRAFEESGLRLRAAIVAVAQTDAFLRR